jgi:[CysO sulfur-carrier protein]-S-L-cysteine hydrolase
MLLINKDIWKKMIDHLQSGLPNEACGILGGKDNRITEIYPTTNIDENPRVRYLIDPKGQFATIKDMRKKGLEMVAIFHSHPESQAYPSVTDVGLAYYPEAYYIIVSFKDRMNPDAHAFRIIDGKIEEHPIIIE